MRVCLIETTAPGSIGSMPRYASLLEEALQGEPGVVVRRIALAPTTISLKRVPRRLRMAAHHCLIAWHATSILRHDPADLYHVLDGSHGYIARWLPPAQTIVTAHDIIPELQTRGCFPLPPPRLAARWLIRTSLRSVARVAHVMADSHATADDLIRYGNVARERISVVPLALPHAFLPTHDQQREDYDFRRNATERFMLHVGNNGFYKNRLGVVRIFDLVRKQLPVRLRLAGPPPDAALTDLIRELGLEPHIEFVVDPDDETVIDLYRSAQLLLFPSLYEGFGWPPLEAMAWGCPVVCSEQGSLPEVVGNASLVADARDEQKLSEHCLSILRDQSLALRLRSAGIAQATEFSQERLRERVLDVYRSVVTGPNAARAPGVTSDGLRKCGQAP